MNKVYLADRLGYAIDFPEDNVIFDPKKRHDFLFIFDATNCNPNGDPENDNMPRQDFESKMGLVSGPCLKRKLRDFMARLYGTEHENSSERMNLYVKHRGLLKKEHRTVAEMLEKKDLKNPTIDQAQKAMREFFWDVRMFGAVLSVGKDEVPEANSGDSTNTGSGGDKQTSTNDKKAGRAKKEYVLNGGQCVGCVSIGMAESINEISPGLMSIVRDARVENPNPSTVKSDGERKAIEIADKAGIASSSMPGNLPWMPYGLYLGTGHYSPKLDKDNLVTSEDLAVLWNGLRSMFDNDPSSARPASHIKALGAWVFTHDHILGNYPVHKLFELIEPKVPSSARHYKDCTVNLGWKKNDGDWSLDEKSKKLHKSGKDIGVTVTELYNDWNE
jgi:CRISPR-associated protein Csd2